jgi:hypothetical protein
LLYIGNQARRIISYLRQLRLSDLVSLIKRIKNTTVGYISRIFTTKYNEASIILETGKKSASIAIHYLAGTAEYRASKSGGLHVRSDGTLRRNNSYNDNISPNLLHRLNLINRTSRVVHYTEREELITRNAKKRVQRMMHYHVSLRPFEVTVVKKDKDVFAQYNDNGSNYYNYQDENCDRVSPDTSFRDDDGGDANTNTNINTNANTNSNDNNNGSPNKSDYDNLNTSNTSNNASPKANIQSNANESPFMCTPQSFPPTPGARSFVMQRSSAFAEDVLYLARDQLRVEKHSLSSNEKTRAVAEALKQQSRLAVFNASDTGNAITLSCGQHCAAKTGNTLYSSTRSMIPVLRNCYVYFEMSVGHESASVPVGAETDVGLQSAMASLSIGLSTQEMPLNSLVGSWKGSVGLCTTGQILDAGRWCSTLDSRKSSYGNQSTVGCLVHIDDGSAFETWDGEMVNVNVTFNVDGVVVKSIGYNDSGSGGGGGGNAGGGNDVPAEGIYGGNSVLAIPKEEELFPTLTLHSPSTKVLARFCSADIKATRRSQIGLPDGVGDAGDGRDGGVMVFTVDGSVLFGGGGQED